MSVIPAWERGRNITNSRPAWATQRNLFQKKTLNECRREGERKEDRKRTDNGF
jgi:hypothetical protein